MEPMGVYDWSRAENSKIRHASRIFIKSFSGNLIKEGDSYNAVGWANNHGVVAWQLVDTGNEAKVDHLFISISFANTNELFVWFCYH